MFPLHRRAHPRYAVHRIASYHYKETSVLTLTLDLGLGGMKIKTHCPLPKDESLRIKLVLGANSIWVKGTVAYSQLTPDMEAVSGIRFKTVSKADRVSLMNCLANLEAYGHRLPLCAMHS